MNLVQRINDAILAAMAEEGVDARACYTCVRAAPPGAAVIEFECSDPRVAGGVERRVRPPGTGDPDLRVVHLPVPGLPEALTVVTSVADVRRGPSHTAELVTQVICGDALVPLKQEGDWYLARVDDGYIGWIRSWYVAGLPRGQREDFERRADHRVVVNHAPVATEPRPDALPVATLVVGTPLVAAAAGKRGWVAVELPDGRHGFAVRGHVGRSPRRATVSREQLTATGLRFLGVPYLWGGTTPHGFDCSGLIQRVFRLHGRLLPRDSDQQARFGAPRPAGALEDRRPGDLLFFGRSDDRITHVGMAIPDRLVLHAYGQVIVNSLDPSHPRYSPILAELYRSTRDPLAPGRP